MARITLILLAMLCVHCDGEPDTGTSSGTLVVTVEGNEKLLYDTLTNVDFDHSAGDYERSIDLRGTRSEGSFSCLIKADVDSGYVNEAQGCTFTRSLDERHISFDVATGSVSFRDDLIEIDLLGSSLEQPDVIIEAHFLAPYERY